MVLSYHFYQFTAFLLLLVVIVFLLRPKGDFDNKKSSSFSKYEYVHLQRCPCLHHPNLDDSIDVIKTAVPNSDFPPILICVLHEVRLLESKLKSINWRNLQGINELTVFFRILLEENFEAVKGCDVVIHIAVSKSPTIQRFHCPGQCLPYHRLTLEYGTWMNLSDSETVYPINDIPLSCTLTLASVRELATKHNANTNSRFFSLTLTLIALHRLQECNENQRWHHYGDSAQAFQPVRRDIELLIVWVASNSRLDLLGHQRLITHNEGMAGTNATISWEATENVYPCRTDTAACAKVPLYQDDAVYLPQFARTRMNHELYLRWPGWACAQRRSLRALSHTLRLYSPRVLVLLDDDTFLNLPMLKGTVMPYLRERDSSLHPLMLGLRMEALMLGGAGYVLGEHAIRRLTDKKMYSSFDEWYKSRFGFYDELVNVTRRVCVGPCVGQVLDERGRVELAVPLVELCANFLSGEHTCHHR